MTITSYDIQLIKQPFQKRAMMIHMLDEGLFRRFNIYGHWVDGDISLDINSNARRQSTLTLSVDTHRTVMSNLTRMAFNGYCRLFVGIQDNNTKQFKWYCQGTFIVTDGNISKGGSGTTLSLSLADLMLDFTGERRGVITGGFEPIVEYENTIQNVIIDTVRVHGQISNYDVAAVSAVKTISVMDKTAQESEQDYQVPYDCTFSMSTTIYDVVNEMVTLYPYWEMYFDEWGKFIVDRNLCDSDNSTPLLDFDDLRGIVIDETVNANYGSIKNVCEVWGKNGLYYGIAKDTTPNSPFNVYAIGEMPDAAVQYDSVYTTYYDKEMTHIKDDGNILAQDWAEYLLYHKCRLQDTITITILPCPFITSVGFKVSYRRQSDNNPHQYVVTNVSHNSTQTTLTLARFYHDNLYSAKPKLAKPTNIIYQIDQFDIQVTCPVDNSADTYILYINGLPVMRSSSPTFAYTIPNQQANDYVLSVAVDAANAQTSDWSDPFTVEISNDYLMIDDTNILLVDNDKLYTQGG